MSGKAARAAVVSCLQALGPHEVILSRELHGAGEAHGRIHRRAEDGVLCEDTGDAHRWRAVGADVHVAVVPLPRLNGHAEAKSASPGADCRVPWRERPRLPVTRSPDASWTPVTRSLCEVTERTSAPLLTRAPCRMAARGQLGGGRGLE